VKIEGKENEKTALRVTAMGHGSRAIGDVQTGRIHIGSGSGWHLNRSIPCRLKLLGDKRPAKIEVIAVV
jgi:hypothetical protein